MSNTVRVEFTIQAEHIDQWEAIAEALCRGPAGVEVQEMLDQLAPGSGELVEAIYEYWNEDDPDADETDNPLTLEASGYQLVQQHMLLALSVDWWFEEEFIDLLQPLLTKLPISEIRIKGSMDVHAEGFLTDE